MNHIWNKRNLKPPMMGSYTTRITKFPYSKDITETLDMIQKYYKNQTKFHEAMLINQQLLYIRYTQFRSDIGFQILQKIKTAYKRLVSVNISALLTKILNSISIEKYNDVIQLPTKETIEYLLIKLVGLFHLILRIVKLSKEAAQCFLKLANLSFFIELTTMVLATLSDIYCIGSDMARKTINHYNKLIKYHLVLKSSKKKWDLPDNYHFPDNLVDCLSKEDAMLIKYTKLENTNSDLIVLQLDNVKLPMQVNKLIRQYDMDIGHEISRNEVDKCTKIVKKKCLINDRLKSFSSIFNSYVGLRLV